MDGVVEVIDAGNGAYALDDFIQKRYSTTSLYRTNGLEGVCFLTRSCHS